MATAFFYKKLLHTPYIYDNIITVSYLILWGVDFMNYSDKLFNKVLSLSFWAEGDKYAQIEDVIESVSKLTQTKVKYNWGIQAFVELPRIGLALKISRDNDFSMLFVEGYKIVLPKHESSCFLVDYSTKYKRIF